MNSSSSFLVSVIIPVYNAEAYLAEAVESAVHLAEAGEILLVDDASTDGSLGIGCQLAKKYPKVKLIQQPGATNAGVSATRNQGIAEAKCDYISFLDADDLYLPNRFTREKEIFLADTSVDGVYGCNQALFESEWARQSFAKRYQSELTTVSEPVAHRELYKTLLFGGKGFFHTSAITLRKQALEKTGLFNTALHHGEDTELWLKLSLQARLVAGSIAEPISIRRVHNNNSIHQTKNVITGQRLMRRSIFNWIVKQPYSFEIKNSFFISLYQSVREQEPNVRTFFWKQLFRTPRLFFTVFFFKKIHQLYFHSGSKTSSLATIN